MMLMGIVAGGVLCLVGLAALLFRKRVSDWMKRRYSAVGDVDRGGEKHASPARFISSQSYVVFVGIATIAIGAGMMLMTSTW